MHNKMTQFRSFVNYNNYTKIEFPIPIKEHNMFINVNPSR